MITDGTAFAGEIHAPANAAWTWRLSGQVFPKDVSKHRPRVHQGEGGPAAPSL